MLDKDSTKALRFLQITEPGLGTVLSGEHLATFH